MYSVIALFCEDIREEKSGMDTLIGVLSDNVLVPSLPFVFARVGVYLRIHVPVKGDDPGRITFWMTSPTPLNFEETAVEPKVIERARREARAKGANHGGLITKLKISPLRIDTAGRINVHVRIGSQEFVAGTLNVQLSPPS